MPEELANHIGVGHDCGLLQNDKGKFHSVKLVGKTLEVPLQRAVTHLDVGMIQLIPKVDSVCTQLSCLEPLVSGERTQVSHSSS